MNIYLIKRTDKVGWDETAGEVIAANNQKEVREISAIGKYINTKITILGKANDKIEKGIILEDFRAG